jgi:hypothetical protein
MADRASSTKVPEADIREDRDELSNDREGRSPATRAYALNFGIGLGRDRRTREQAAAR